MSGMGISQMERLQHRCLLHLMEVLLHIIVYYDIEKAYIYRVR